MEGVNDVSPNQATLHTGPGKKQIVLLRKVILDLILPYKGVR